MSEIAEELSEKYVPDFRYIKIEKTTFWDVAFVQKLGPGAKLICTYIFDKNAPTHCCELTPSYYMEFAGIEWVGGNVSDMPDEQRQELEEEIRQEMSQSESSHYRWCSRVENDKPCPAGWAHKYQDEETPEERMQEMLEYYQGNPW